MSSKKARVGIIGVGRMGQPMVKHLIKHGYEVTAVDVSRENLAKVAEMGAKIVDTPAALGAVSDFVILGVGYDEEVNEVTLGAHGVLAALPRGAIIAVSSTVSPDTVKALDAAARARGCDVLDAPICRGRWFADEGKLLALFGGRDEVVAHEVDIVLRLRVVVVGERERIAVGLEEVGDGRGGGTVEAAAGTRMG